MLRVVLSGGPCAGKSTSLSMLERLLVDKLGKKVFVVSETATELITSGVTPKELDIRAFQDYCMDKQLEKEAMYEDVIKKYYNPDDVVILYDRGMFDQIAYIGEETFKDMLNQRGLYLSDIISHYDAIIHLVTAAKGTNMYTNANNSARLETETEAIDADDRTLKGNMLHPHVRVIDNSTDFDGKVQRVLDCIFDLLGEPIPSEIERKFLIKYPTEEVLNNLAYSSKSTILQTYLKSDDVERRVRQRGSRESGYTYYYTEKQVIDDYSRMEREKKIDMTTYVSLLTEADTTLHQVQKDRYCFMYLNQYFEMDLYPYSNEYAIIEIELHNKDDEVVLPEFIEVVKEVTTDSNFKNSNLAKIGKLPI